MSLKDIDLDAALRRLAERRIEDAMREGKFDNLAGHGKPLDLEPMPANEEARMTWWVLRILRQNEVVPDEVKWRKALDYLRDRLDRLTSEAELATVVQRFNELVHKLNTLGTNALNAGGAVVPLCIDAERERLRDRLKRV